MTDGWDEGYGNTLVGKKRIDEREMDGEESWKRGGWNFCVRISRIFYPCRVSIYFGRLVKGGELGIVGVWRLERTGGL